MGRRALTIARLLLAGSVALPWTGAADTATLDLERTFTTTVQPFVARYCAGCHSGATPAAQFDLHQYSTLAAVVRDYPRWNLVLEKLAARQMPPTVAPGSRPSA
jgi:hypothetical protein